MTDGCTEASMSREDHHRRDFPRCKDAATPTPQPDFLDQLKAEIEAVGPLLRDLIDRRIEAAFNLGFEAGRQVGAQMTRKK